MVKDLVIAYYYSVEKSSTGQILRRFFPSLPSDKFVSTIISSKTANDYSDENCRVINVKESKSVIIAEKIIRNIGMNDIMMTPDYYRYSWGGNALKVAKKEIENHKYDYIHTVSFPSSSHLIGYELKKKYGLPWVAQFYDPWHGNPYRPISSKYFYDKDAEYESRVASCADLIILPCEELVNDWHLRYGRLVDGKIVELPFVSEVVEDRDTASGDKPLIISMIGSSNSKRMSTPFFEAVRELVDESPEVANQLRIYQVGYVTEAEKEIIKALGLSGIVVQTGHLSENQCAQYFIDADIFLAIDADVKNNYFFPSKLLKYFSYQRPILGLVTENSVMSRELIQSGHIALPVNNTSAIKEYIYKALIDYSSLCSFNKDYRKRFYPAAVVNEFITYLNRIVFN